MFVWNAFAAPELDCFTDIVFVMDASGSIGVTNFNLMKSFVSHLVGRMDVDSGSTRVGLVTFSSFVGSSFNLSDHNTVTSMQRAISRLTYSPSGTNTAAALAYIRTTMLTLAAGDRGEVPNVGVVITDGHSDNSNATKVRKM